MNRQLVNASEITSFFRKKTGTMIYLRMNESSIKFLKLDPSYVYGVCHNGNVTRIHPETLVVQESAVSFLDSIIEDTIDEIKWNKTVGASMDESLSRLCLVLKHKR